MWRANAQVRLLLSFVGSTDVDVNIKGICLSLDIISPAQCRGARGMLGWSQMRLAEAASVSKPTIADFERGARIPHRNNLAAIREAFEMAGIEFISENDGGAGVRLKKSSSTE